MNELPILIGATRRGREHKLGCPTCLKRPVLRAYRIHCECGWVGELRECVRIVERTRGFNKD